MMKPENKLRRVKHIKNPSICTDQIEMQLAVTREANPEADGEDDDEQALRRVLNTYGE